MPASITAASIGNTADLPTTAAALKQLANTLAKQAMDNLAQSGNVTTGALAKSITVGDVQITNGAMQIDIQALDYLQFVNKGVRGTKGGQGAFVFKSNFPSQAMISSVSQWMAAKGLTALAIKNTGKIKPSKAGVTNSNGTYAVARSILQHGIKPTGFFDSAIETVQQQAQQMLGDAMAVDVANALPKTLN